MEYKKFKNKLDGYLKESGYQLKKNPTRWVKNKGKHLLYIEFYKSYYSNKSYLKFTIDYIFLNKKKERSFSIVEIKHMSRTINNSKIIFDMSSSDIKNEIILDNLDDYTFKIIENLISKFEDKYSNINNVINDIGTKHLYTIGEIMNIMGYEWKKHLFSKKYSWNKIRESRLHEYIDLDIKQ